MFNVYIVGKKPHVCLVIPSPVTSNLVVKLSGRHALFLIILSSSPLRLLDSAQIFTFIYQLTTDIIQTVFQTLGQDREPANGHKACIILASSVWSDRFLSKFLSVSCQCCCWAFSRFSSSSLGETSLSLHLHNHADTQTSVA